VPITAHSFSRIDDTDQARNRTEWIDYIYDQMNEYGLDYDVTFKQSDRLDRYADAKKIEKTEDGVTDIE
jgi:glutamyl-tRNA synthetase